jgi:hypothetical protein
MEGKPKRILQTSLLIALPVAAFGAALALLNLLHTPYATWLEVEAPAYAVAGNTLDIRIRLGEVPEPSLLDVDLYQLDKRHRAISHHSSLTPSPSVQSGGTYSFRLEVKEEEKLAILQLVMYLSPKGDWQTMTHAARSEAIPVKTHGSQAPSPVLRRTRAFVIGSSRNRDIETAYMYSSVASWMPLLGLLGAGGLVCLIRSTRRSVANPGAARERLFWRCASILLFLGFLWEILRLEERLSEWGRSVISGLDLYYLRDSLQKIVLALLAAGVAAILVVSFRLVSKNRALLYAVLAGIALAGYMGLSLAGVLSFHYIDSLKRIRLNGASVFDFAKAACAAAVLGLALIAPRPHKTPAR